MLKLVKSVCYSLSHMFHVYKLSNFCSKSLFMMISASNFEPFISRLRPFRYDIGLLSISIFQISSTQNSLLFVFFEFCKTINTVSARLPLSSETGNLLDAVSGETIHFRLTDLCQKVLGEALDKTEQVSSHLSISKDKRSVLIISLFRSLDIKNCLDRQLGCAPSSS